MRFLQIQLLIVIFFVGYPMVSIAEISIGLRTMIWPHIWQEGKGLKEQKKISKDKKVKWEVALANLGKYRELGALWNIVIVRQGEDGPDKFSRLTRVLKEHRDRGIGVVMRLIESKAMYDNLEDSAQSYGYNKQYYDWVVGLTKVAAKDADVYLIGNEVDHRPLNGKDWVDYPRYNKLLKTALLAIRDNDPGASIADHGVSAFSLGIAIAQDIANQKGLIEGFKFFKRFNYDRNIPRDLASFKWQLKKEDIQRRIAITNATVTDSTKLDLLQFHYYHNWRALPEVLDWLDRKMTISGTKRPLIATEIGYRIPTKVGKSWKGRKANVADMSRYSQTEHAVNLAKDFAILASRGIEQIEYWNMRFHHARSPSAKLFPSTRVASVFIPTQASACYELLAKSLSGTVPAAGLLTQNNRITEYRFVRPGESSKDFSIVWANDQPVTFKSDQIPKVKSIINITGSELKIDPETTITITQTPVLLVRAGVVP